MESTSFVSDHTDLLTQLKTRENNYIQSCSKYQCKIDAGAIVCIRNEHHIYKPSIKLSDAELLAICDTLSELDHVQTLNLRDCQITCNGAYLLCQLLHKNKNIQVIDLRFNQIADLGAQALSEMLQIQSTKLKTLILHYNAITQKGAFHIAQGLKLNTSLEELDISHNKIGSYGANVIRAALMERQMLQCNNLKMIEASPHPAFNLNATDNDTNNNEMTQSTMNLYGVEQHEERLKNPENSSPEQESEEKAAGSTSPVQVRRARSNRLRSPYRPNQQLLQKWVTPAQLSYIQSQLGIFIKFEGNFLKEEIFNSVTHGVGLVLSIIASIILLNVASYHSYLCQIACGIFSFTLFFMYLSSTLYHSCVYQPCARHVFHVLDYSSIFLLIAGTYTPILLIGFRHSPFHSLILFSGMWIIAICGVTYSSYADPHDDKWNKLMVLYLTMSFSGLVSVKPVIETLDNMALVWIAIGGLWYIGGIWFLKNDATAPILHSIWHVCVILASACHFWAILVHIIPMDELERPYIDFTLWHFIDNIFFALPISKLVSYAIFGDIGNVTNAEEL